MLTLPHLCVWIFVCLQHACTEWHMNMVTKSAPKTIKFKKSKNHSTIDLISVWLKLTAKPRVLASFRFIHHSCNLTFWLHGSWCFDSLVNWMNNCKIVSVWLSPKMNRFDIVTDAQSNGIEHIDFNQTTMCREEKTAPQEREYNNSIAWHEWIVFHSNFMHAISINLNADTEAEAKCRKH